MYSVSSPCEATPGCWDNAALSRSHKAMQFSQVTASSEESKNITIYTDEGDKVTLSYDHQTQASYANLKALSYQGSFAVSEDTVGAKEALTRIQGEQFLFEDSRNLTISIEGDLNELEVKDIKEAIMKIDKIMTDLLHGGDTSEAMAGAEKLKDLETLSGLEADYQYERSVLVEQIAVKESTTTLKSEMAEAPAASPDEEWTSLNDLIERMSNIIEETKIKPSKFFKPLRQLFTGISKGLERHLPGHKIKRHMADLIGSELAKRLEQLSEKANSPAEFEIE